MNVLLIGSGGREHAIAWKLSLSNKLESLFIAPGNAGTSKLGTNVNIDVSNFKNIETFILNNNIDILVVGPENIIVKGVFDYLNPIFPKLIIIAPSKKGSLLEGSKKFAKEFMQKNDIPTAKYASFKTKEFEKGLSYLKTISPPYVLKANGLAAGKGVVILDSLVDAERELQEMLIEKKFGEASNEVLIEEFLSGIELSVFVLTNGLNYKILPTAKDYKRIGEGDTGLNTGGMGSVSPVPFVNKDLMNKIENSIIKPTIDGLKKGNILYNGFIFFGLIYKEGEIKVIEYNVRLGDPETQVVLPRLKSDLLDLFSAINDIDTFNEKTIEISDQYCSTVILTSKGYPGKYSKGFPISGIKKVDNKNLIFQAGTINKNNQIQTNGGRVISVGGLGDNIKLSLKNSYDLVNVIHFEGMYYRKDIGSDLITK